MIEENEVEHNSVSIRETCRVPYPWRRYFARSLDLSLYSLIWMVVIQLVFRWNMERGFFISLFSSFLTCGLMLLIEPILLSAIGTTLGKWVFGLVVRDMNGCKLTYKQAAHRTFGVFCRGMGFNIPIYILVREFKSYSECKSCEMMQWDEDICYTIKDRKILRPIGFLVLNAAVFLLVYLIGLQAHMPKHRGDITAEQYFENCNDLMNYNNIDYGKYLNEEGKWVDEEFDGDYTINLFPQQLPEYELTVSDGSVTGVRLEIETTESDWIQGYYNHLYIAVMSFVAAQKEMNCIQLQKSHLLDEIGNGFEDCSFTKAGIKVTNSVVYKGYNSSAEGQYLIPIEGEEQYFSMVFTMEKVGE